MSRQAIRRLANAPGFAAVCIATLAIGIGVNSAVFTLIDRVLLKPLPVPRPAELHRIGNTDQCCVIGSTSGSVSIFSHDLYSTLKNAAPEFRNLAAFQANTRVVTVGRADGDALPQTLNGEFVSGNYFQMFEVTPASGRLLVPADDAPGAAPAAVISHAVWQDRFQGRADIIGTPVALNGVAATIVGVAPRGFFGAMPRPDPAQIWIALSAEPQLQPAARLLHARTSHWLYVMGRLQPGADTGALQERLSGELRNWVLANATLSQDEREQLPQAHVRVVPAPGGVDNMRNAVAPTLTLLQGIAGLVLVIACANLASLLLARGIDRRAEIAVRSAIGATRGRIVRQFLAESSLLGLIGGGLGLLLSPAIARGISSLAFQGSQLPFDASPSALVVLFTGGVSLLTGALFGILPAVIGSRSSSVDVLRAGPRTVADRGGRLRQSLVALQIALSLAIVTSAGLLATSLQRLQQQDFGVRSDGRYVVDLAPTFAMVPADRLASTYERLTEELKRIPGVTGVGYALYAPMSGDNWARLISVEGRSPAERLQSSWNRISPGYFATVGTPLLSGREFDARDRPGAPLVAIVNEEFARRFFGGGQVLGRRIGGRPASGPATFDFEIVGVVANAKYQGGRLAAYPMYFLPFHQQPEAARLANERAGVALDRSHFAQAIALEVRGGTGSLEPAIVRALAAVDRRITARRVTSMEAQIAGGFGGERLIATLTGVFGVVALLMACLGVYGVTACAVSRRTREIGIRLAIGATSRDVLRSVLGGASTQLVAGGLLGIGGALLAGRFLKSRLFGVSAQDPTIILAALATLALATLLAAWLPARRATRVDPLIALRSE